MGLRTCDYGRLFRALKRKLHCVICGGKYKLEFAHLRPNGLFGMGRGLRQRYMSVKNNPNDYVLLCKRCHNEFDKGYSFQ